MEPELEVSEFQLRPTFSNISANVRSHERASLSRRQHDRASVITLTARRGRQKVLYYLLKIYEYVVWHMMRKCTLIQHTTVQLHLTHTHTHTVSTARVSKILCEKKENKT